MLKSQLNTILIPEKYLSLAVISISINDIKTNEIENDADNERNVQKCNLAHIGESLVLTVFIVVITYYH